MPRSSLLLTAIAVALLGLGGLWAQPVAVAQDATPAAEEMMPEGIIFEPVSFALGAELASPADVFVARITLEPGVGFPVEESDPTAGFLLVESGTFTVEVEAPVAVTRGEGFSEAMATAQTSEELEALLEESAAGDVVELEAGDSAFIPGSINGEIRNDGDEPAVGLAFLVGPPEGMMAEATPAP